MRVLSLFDGMSCGQLALNRLGVNIQKYYASEVDKYAIAVTKANFPNTIHIGDVRNVDVKEIGHIDLLLGGSPCQNFSFAGSRKGMTTKEGRTILELEAYLELKEEGFEFEGQSYLFWEYVRIFRELRKINPNIKFLLENVVMSKDWEWVISKQFDIHPIKINSALVSAQNRNRLYWTNIGLVSDGLFGDMKPGIKQPKDKGILLKDILEDEVDEKYFLSDKAVNRISNSNNSDRCFDSSSKSMCLISGYNKQGRDNQYIVHNRQERNPNRPSIKNGTSSGGSGPLSRNDGKTYCLDTGQSNAVEILGGDFRYDEGFRWRNQGKTPTLCCSEEVYVNKPIIRRLTPIECERLQTVPDNYTNHVSDTQRYRMLGNGWTIDVIAHILKHIL